MTLYAIGDLQGCIDSFESLLEHIRFDPDNDRLWLVGDLVNRGPDSLGVLRRVIALGDCVTSVLGNHDLHLLAVAAGARRTSRKDTFGDVLRAKDSEQMLNWIRRRPLLHHDESNNRVLVHAGIPPVWSVKKAAREATKIESMLRSDDWRRTVTAMYGDTPSRWSKKLGKKQRLRYTINGLTRMRFCDAVGNLDFNYTGPPGTQPKRLMPWFHVAARPAADTHIVFGHWAALGVKQLPNLTALDSGCVWGRRLTAIALNKKKKGARIRVKC